MCCKLLTIRQGCFLQRIALPILRLIIEHRHEDGSDNHHLEFRESHAQARVPTDAPANISKVYFLVLATLEPGRVEFFRVGIDLRVHVHVVDQVHGEGVLGNDLACFLGDDHILAGDVVAEGGAHHLQPDALTQGQIDGGKLRLPRIHIQRGKDLLLGLVWLRGVPVAGENTVDFGLDSIVPFFIRCEVDEEPRSIDTRVELTSEQGTEDELYDK